MPIEELEILKAACCVAGVDGGISDREMVLLRTLASSAAVGEASFGAMVDRATTEPESYREEFDLPLGDADEAMKTLVDIAAAQGDPSERQQDMLRYFAERVGVGRDRLEALVTKRVADHGTAEQRR